MQINPRGLSKKVDRGNYSIQFCAEFKTNMMKHFFLFALFLCGLNTANAQLFSLNGKVINQMNQAVEFVSVSLLKNDSIILKRTQTDSLGQFVLKAEKGNYRLVLKQFGKELSNTEVLLDQDLELGNIAIDESSELEGVAVTARKKILEQKVDRLIFNVENSVSATGGTALDVLKVTPTVRVQNDNISIVGKGEVLVMIDDRLQRMSQSDLVDFLKSIPSGNIKSIEVITAPPAKYDAEGNSGLINIKLKTARANSWNANVGASYTQKTYAGGNVTGLFNYKHNKLSLQASIHKGMQKYLTTSTSQIFYTDALWNEKISNTSDHNVLGAGLGVDYKLTQKWTSGIKYLGSFTDKTVKNNPWTSRYSHATESIGSYVVSDVNANNKPEMNSVNWFHAFDLDSSGKTITADFDYFNYRKKDYRFFAGNELDHSKQIVPGTFFSSTNTNLNKVQNYSGKIDVSLPYKGINIGLGGKISHTNTDNDLVVYDRQTGTPILNTEQSNRFNYKEVNEALYFSAGKKLNSRWETQIGLRMEATQTEGYSENLNQTNKNNYIRLFPTAYVTYVPNDSNSFSLNYSRRIRRPDFDYLNPFVVKTSPYYYSEGNPFLKPSFIDNLEFSYVRNQNWVNSVYFSQVSDFGQELSIVDANTNVTRSTPLNYANTYQIGFSTYWNFKKWAWWNGIAGFNVNYQNVKSKSSFIASTDGFNGYLYTNHDFTLNKSKSVFAGLNYAFQLPGRYQIFQISTMHMLDVSLKFLFLNKNLSLTLVAEDLLNAQRPLITYYSNGIKNNSKSYDDTRGFRISVGYKFGNAGLKSSPRDFGNEDERDRTN